MAEFIPVNRIQIVGLKKQELKQMKFHLREGKMMAEEALKLRYYAPYFDEKIHRKILELLKEVGLKHNIDHEIVEVPEGAEQEIYREDFVSRTRVLSKRIGGSVARALRSRRGRGYVYLRGTIALVRSAKVEWFASYKDPLYEKWKSYDKDAPTSLGFLEMVLEKGAGPLEEILSGPIGVAEHELIVDTFIVQKILAGEYKREVQVGKPMVIIDKYGKKKKIARKIADILYKTRDTTWVIEAKPYLDAQAIGQAQIYRDLYKKEHPDEKVKCGVVCNYADEELYNIGKNYIDKIFVLKKITRKGTVDWRR